MKVTEKALREAIIWLADLSNTEADRTTFQDVSATRRTGVGLIAASLGNIRGATVHPSWPQPARRAMRIRGAAAAKPLWPPVKTARC